MEKDYDKIFNETMKDIINCFNEVNKERKFSFKLKEEK